MIAPAEAVRALWGIWRIVRDDPMALVHFNRTVEGFWNSFYAAILAAPAYIAIVMLHQPAPGQAPSIRSFGVEVATYVLSWVAFPVMAHLALQLLGRTERFIDLVVVLNWWAVVQSAAFVPVQILYALEPTRVGPASLLGFSLTLAIIYYQWFIVRAALRSTAGPAVMIVLLDLFSTQLVNKIADWAAAGL
jgi:hypothetical protein